MVINIIKYGSVVLTSVFFVTLRSIFKYQKTNNIMAFLTDEKLVIVGAGGMIGSNMVQSVLMLGLTPNICLYDIYEPGVHADAGSYS